MPQNATFRELVGRIYDAAVDPQLWSAFAERAASRFAARRATIALRVPGPADGGTFYDHGCPGDVRRAYREYYFRLDPLGPNTLTAAAGTVFRTDDLLDPRELARTEFYNDWLEPAGLTTALHAVLARANGRMSSGFVLARGDGDPPFAPSDLAAVGLLVPHLQRALAIHEQLESAQADREIALQVGDDLDVGVVVCDAAGRVLHANALARGFAGDGLTVGAAGLRALHAADHARLERAIAAAANTAAGRGRSAGGVVTIARPSGKLPLVATVVPFVRTERRAQLLPRTAVLVLLRDPARACATSAGTAELLRRVYDLTPAEARLTELVAGGLDPRAAAERLDVTTATARVQLKRVFAKMGVHRQAELVQVVLSLGAAAPRG